MVWHSKVLKPPKGVEASYEDKMRYAGALAAEVLEGVKPYVKEGVSTLELDAWCHGMITQGQGAIPACLGYRGFPASVCISLNEVVCHGIPGKRRLRPGDILNIDVTVLAYGVHGDTSTMFFVGPPSPLDLHLCRTTQRALYSAISLVRPGLRLQEIGRCIERIAQEAKLSVVREYGGHFIGRNFHEEPTVLHFFAEDGGYTLEPGMTFTIEPMLNLGGRAVRQLQDGWTVRTKDGAHSAQYEHTLLVNEKGCEVLTLRADESFPKFHPEN